MKHDVIQGATYCSFVNLFYFDERKSARIRKKDVIGKKNEEEQEESFHPLVYDVCGA